MIRNKKDFEGKILLIPRNIKRNKFKQIKNKFFRLGFGDDGGRLAQFKTFQQDKTYKGICLTYYKQNVELVGSAFIDIMSPISIKEFLKDENDECIIRCKEDFKGKTIKIPQNISEKKFDKIEAKLERLGFDTFFIDYSDIEKYPYIAIDDNSFNKITLWNEKPNEDKSRKQKKIDKYFLSLQEISIKEFLKDKSNGYTIEVGLDLNSIRLMVTTIGNDIKVKCGCYDEKEFKKGDKITISINKKNGDRSWTDEVLIYIGEYKDFHIAKRTKGLFIEKPIYLRKEDYDLSDAEDLIKLLKENFKEE